MFRSQLFSAKKDPLQRFNLVLLLQSADKILLHGSTFYFYVQFISFNNVITVAADNKGTCVCECKTDLANSN